MGNTFGRFFRVTTFGESHGTAIGAVIDGCPAGLEIDISQIQRQMDRRRPGQSQLTTARAESDTVRIVSGTESGIALGAPITLILNNQDRRSEDYASLNRIPRPSHADFTYRAKYGIAASSGGGRASARETAARVAAGAVAELFLRHMNKVSVTAWVSAVGAVTMPEPDYTALTRELVDASPTRCPHPDAAQQMAALIQQASAEQDSIGGVITCVCQNIPAGWGEPVFDKLDALLAHAVFSIPAVKGVEIGSGFSGARMRGSEHNDCFVMNAGHVRPASNRSGGIQGGISNGEPIIIRAAFKPAPSIKRAQQTVSYEGEETALVIPGRHDPCVLPRAVPVVEAMVALALADTALAQRMQAQPG